VADDFSTRFDGDEILKLIRKSKEVEVWIRTSGNRMGEM
jgi:hypothetical protein